MRDVGKCINIEEGYGVTRNMNVESLDPLNVHTVNMQAMSNQI